MAEMRHNRERGNIMGRISISFIGLTTALALTVVACGDDGTGLNDGDELTSAEVAAVMAVFGSAFESVGVSAQAVSQRLSTIDFSGAAPAQAPIDVNETFDVSVPCESGTLEVSGSITGSIDDVTYDIDITTTVRWDPNGCVVGDGTNTFTVDGAPHVDLVLDMTSTQDALTMSGTETGGFSFTSSDGRSGSCALDVTFSVVTGNTGIDSSVTGTICGLEASTFETLGT